MLSPLEPFFRMQFTVWEEWAHFVANSVRAYERLAEHQANLLRHHPYIRFHDVIPGGADWFDHYGKRHHDVDVEKV